MLSPISDLPESTPSRYSYSVQKINTLERIKFVSTLPSTKLPNLLICNLRSFTSKIDELDAVVSFNQTDMVCITETWLSPAIPDNLVSLSNFNLFRNDRLVSNSGVTLYQGAPGSKFSKAPLVEVLKARVEHRICTSFLGGPGHVHPENFLIYTL